MAATETGTIDSLTGCGEEDLADHLPNVRAFPLIGPTQSVYMRTRLKSKPKRDSRNVPIDSRRVFTAHIDHLCTVTFVEGFGGRAMSLLPTDAG